MKEYLILLRGGDARMAELSEKESQAHMQLWGTYMQDLAQKGYLVGGLPLQREGRIMDNSGVVEGVVNSQKGEPIGGWLHFKAENYEQAIELSKACPIFELNGNLEIREIMPMDM